MIFIGRNNYILSVFLTRNITMPKLIEKVRMASILTERITEYTEYFKKIITTW